MKRVGRVKSGGGIARFFKPRTIAETAVVLGTGLLIAWGFIAGGRLATEPGLGPGTDDPGGKIVAWEHVVDFREPIAVYETVFWEPDDTRSLRELIRYSPLVKDKTVLEIGTGSGLLALCCAKNGAERVVATDINPHAVANARFNARRLGVDGVIDVRPVSPSNPGAFAAVDADEKFDLIISNPPWEDRRPVSIDEFALADEGFVLMRSLLTGLGRHLKPGGRAYLVYGCVTAIRKLQELAPQHGLELQICDDRELDELDEVFLPGMAVVLWPSSQAEDDAGFVSLFDGRTLSGWQGSTADWSAEDGRLVYRATKKPRSSRDLPGLKLMSRKQYADFILRFEFKLERGSNNGVAIRAPLKGDPAFVGMEIQIIDTPGWPGKLKPFQVHGSVYGVVAAKKGHLRPAGEWNSEEILCRGRRVKVTLNGAVIVDADLDKIGTKTLDGRAHPGLLRDSGHIGFLGHTGRVELRNIRIKELPAGEKPGTYFPPPESKGGWRKLDEPEDIRRLAGMDPKKLDELKEWLLESDKRNFAAVVIRNGHIVLEVERGNSSKTDSRRVASVSKAICATVLAIASEQSRRGRTPRKMSFDDPAFEFIPWARPLSDPRKAKITVKQLLNHTSGICPEATGAANRGPWKHVLGHDDDPRTANLAFDPGTKCGYSTFAFYHAALVCENVTGKPYDRFAIETLFKPIGCEHWWFQHFDGGEKYGRHPSHSMGMPARDLARIAYCMLRGGRWKDKQVVPEWFVKETAAPTHKVKEPELRFQRAAGSFSHGWELPARLTVEGPQSGRGIPADARYKPGSGGQLIAFVPSLDLVVTRQTGGSGSWQYEEYLRRACAAVLRKAD